MAYVKVVISVLNPLYQVNEVKCNVNLVEHFTCKMFGCFIIDV